MGIILPRKFTSRSCSLNHLFTFETLFLTYIKLYHATMQVVLAIEKRETFNKYMYHYILISLFKTIRLNFSDNYMYVDMHYT